MMTLLILLTLCQDARLQRCLAVCSTYATPQSERACIQRCRDEHRKGCQ